MRLSLFVRGKVKRSVPALIRLACVIALLGLATFAVSLLYPRPLVVIVAMSVGHVIGAVAVVLYGLAVVLDTIGSGRSTPANRSESGAPGAGDPELEIRE